MDKSKKTTLTGSKKAALNMLESIISGDASAAEEHTHSLLQEKIQDLFLGEKCKEDDKVEMCDECECDPCKCKDDKKDDDKKEKDEDKKYNFEKTDKKDK